jgi:hypothetical protein
MSTEQQHPVIPPSTGDTWGAPGGSAEPGARQPKRWSGRKIAGAAAIAVGIAAAGSVAVHAASDSTSSATEQGPGGGGMGGGSGGGMAGGPGGAMSEALHGEYVVSDGDGGYTTELMQNGEVTEVSDTSITATSEDGYTRTYTVDPDTVTGGLSDIGTGDEVTIVASVSGDTATVSSVVEEGTDQMGQAPPDQGADSSQGG